MVVNKEAGFRDALTAVGRGIGHVAPYAGMGLGLAGATVGLGALGMPSILSQVPAGAGLGRTLMHGLGMAARAGGVAGASTAGLLGGRFLGQKLTSGTTGGPGTGTAAAAGAAGSMLTHEHLQRLHDHVSSLREALAAQAGKTAAVRDNAYYVGAQNAGHIFHALTQLGARPQDLRRVRKVLHRSAIATALATKENPHGTKNFRRGVTSAMKSFHQAAKDLESFRNSGGPGTARVEHDLESSKIRYYEPDEPDGTRHSNHFAVRRPGALWGSTLETFGMPKAAAARLPYLVMSMKLAEAPAHGHARSMPAINFRKLEDHANEHRLMSLLGIGLRGHQLAMD